MKKSNFAVLILGTIGGVCFSLGMCMALVPEWGMPSQGAACGGLAILLAALLLGVGVCMVTVFAQMAMDIVIGLAGIVILMMLIPLPKGIHD